MSRGFAVSLRAGLIALAAVFGLASAAQADTGSIRIQVIKAGWILGGSGGSGVLVFKGQRYQLAIGGVDWGLVFGASSTDLVGTVSNIRRPSDVAGVYAAGGVGAALGPGARAIVLTNPNGAVLRLTGRQVGAMINLDLSGMAISLR
jgi:hypothetical protein